MSLTYACFPALRSPDLSRDRYSERELRDRHRQRELDRELRFERERDRYSDDLDDRRYNPRPSSRRERRRSAEVSSLLFLAKGPTDQIAAKITITCVQFLHPGLYHKADAFAECPLEPT